MIPLMFEAGYEPLGWLGIMMGTRLWYGFYGDTLSNTATFDSKVGELCREIGPPQPTAAAPTLVVSQTSAATAIAIAPVSVPAAKTFAPVEVTPAAVVAATAAATATASVVAISVDQPVSAPEQLPHVTPSGPGLGPTPLPLLTAVSRAQDRASAAVKSGNGDPEA